MAKPSEPKVDLNEKLTQQVAQLARLELTENELKTFTSQLNQIVKYIDQLQSVDVTGVEPLTHPLEKAPALRKDEVIEFAKNEDGKSKTLDPAPESIDDCFKVPKVI